MSKPRALAEHPNTRGTAAVANVTESQTDTTAGRLLKVGDFGWGVPASEVGPRPPNDDLNDITVPGLYFASDPDILNRPPRSSAVLHVNRDVDRRIQLAIGGGGAGAYQYIRNDNGSGWGPWKTVYDQDSILGTVSHASGVPTGAIIERDSNGGGQFVKYADGTQICWNANLGGEVINIAAGNVFRSPNIVWTYPVAFSSAALVSAVMAPAAIGVWMGNSLAGAANVTGRLFAATSIGTSQNVQAIAVGRWY